MIITIFLISMALLGALFLFNQMLLSRRTKQTLQTMILPVICLMEVMYQADLESHLHLSNVHVSSLPKFSFVRCLYAEVIYQSDRLYHPELSTVTMGIQNCSEFVIMMDQDILLKQIIQYVLVVMLTSSALLQKHNHSMLPTYHG